MCVSVYVPAAARASATAAAATRAASSTCARVCTQRTCAGARMMQRRVIDMCTLKALNDQLNFVRSVWKLTGGGRSHHVIDYVYNHLQTYKHNRRIRVR